MKKAKINKTNIATIIFLFILLISSYFLWENMYQPIYHFLSGNFFLFIIIASIISIVGLHYRCNSSSITNIQNQNGSVEKSIDYLQFTFTFVGILMTVKIISTELFAYFFMTEESRCLGLNGLDYTGFIVTIIVLLVYCYNKLSPIITDIIYEDQKIPTNSNESLKVRDGKT